MPRWARNALVLALPPLLVTAASFTYGVDLAAWLPHFVSLLLAAIAVVMAIRLRWFPGTVILPARFLLWAGIGAAWGVAWSFVLVLGKEYGSIDYAITTYGMLCAFTVAVGQGASLILFLMMRRAANRPARSRPWTTFG